MIQYRKHIGNNVVCQLLGMASNHPIMLRYYEYVRSDESREKTLAGTDGHKFLATFNKSIILRTLWSLWILVSLDKGRFWSLIPNK